jgi:hypothetical protein
VGQELVEITAGSVAGYDDVAAAAAGKDVRHAGEIETSFCFVRVVAGIAGLFKERKDVVLEVGFLGCAGKFFSK